MTKETKKLYLELFLEKLKDVDNWKHSNYSSYQYSGDIKIKDSKVTFSYYVSTLRGTYIYVTYSDSWDSVKLLQFSDVWFFSNPFYKKVVKQTKAMFKAVDDKKEQTKEVNYINAIKNHE
jgi:hypothetical protein